MKNIIMPFWIFKKRDDVDSRIDVVEDAVKESFKHIKKDISSLSGWVKHFKDQHFDHHMHIMNAHDKVDEVHERINELESTIKELSKQLEDVQTPVQIKQEQTVVRPNTRLDMFKQPSKQEKTAVQTDKFSKGLTPMERAIVSILLNTDMKLTYDDLSIALGRDKSTIRGQMNNIKQKRENLIVEVLEPTGRKRFYIEEKTKGKVFKERNTIKKSSRAVKVRVKKKK